jgi:spore coat protein U-like protein
MKTPARRRGSWVRRGLRAVFAAVSFFVVPAATLASVSCSVTAVSLNFGVYDVAATQPDDSVGTLTVTCNYVAPGGGTGVSYVVALSNGQNASTPSARAMADGSQRLAYNVFDDAGRTRVWASGTGGTVVASGSMTVGPGVGNGTRTAIHTIYGRLPALQDAEPGTYLDTLVITLTY